MDASHNNKTPHIKIIDMSTSDTGVAVNVSFEVNDAFLDMVKREEKVDKISQEFLSNYVYNLLENCSNEKNGYGYKTIKNGEVTIDK